LPTTSLNIKNHGHKSPAINQTEAYSGRGEAMRAYPPPVFVKSMVSKEFSELNEWLTPPWKEKM